MQYTPALNEGRLPSGALLLPTEEQLLPTLRCTSYEWKNLFPQVGQAHRTVVCIASGDGVHDVGRPITNAFRVGEDILPRQRSTSDMRTDRFPRWGASLPATDDARLPAGGRCLPHGRSASDLRAHRGPRWDASRPAATDARLPTRRTASFECMNRVVRSEEAMPPSVVGVTTTHERMSRDRRRRALDASATSSRGLDLVYRKTTTYRISGAYPLPLGCTPPTTRRSTTLNILTLAPPIVEHGLSRTQTRKCARRPGAIHERGP